MKKIFITMATLLALGCATEVETPQQRLLIGTSTEGASEGLYLYNFDAESCKAERVSMAKIENSTFATYQDGELFSVVENTEESAAVTQFSLDVESGEFKKLSSELCRGAFPCHILRGDGWVATANYGGGSISLFELGEDNSLGKMRQHFEYNTAESVTPSHMHCLIPSPDGKMLFANDLGNDSIYRFSVASGEQIKSGAEPLTPIHPAVAVAKGSGPRHMTFAPNGERAYLINELSGTVIGFDYNGESLHPFQVIESDSVGGGGCADIHMSEDGRFLYSSNRLKDDGISTFAVEQSSGKLTKIDYTLTGIHPRNFTLSPDGKLLLVACRDSHAVQIYSRDEQSGKLTYLGAEHDIKVDSPMFVKFL